MVAVSNGKVSFDAIGPASDGEAVTTSDTDELTKFARSLYIGVGGTVVVVTTSGETLTFVGAQTGQILPVQCKQVKATGTTATNIVALW